MNGPIHLSMYIGDSLESNCLTSGFVSLAFDLADSGNDHQYIRFCSLGEQLVVNNQQRRRKAPTSSSTLQCLSKTQTRGHKSPLQTFSSILYISFARPLPDCRSRKQKKVITHVPGTRYMYQVQGTRYRYMYIVHCTCK